jgi:hypothetical protein
VVLLLLKADGVLLCCWPTAGDGASWLAAGVGLLLVLLSLSLDRLAAAWWSAFQYQWYSIRKLHSVILLGEAEGDTQIQACALKVSGQPKTDTLNQSGRNRLSVSSKTSGRSSCTSESAPVREMLGVWHCNRARASIRAWPWNKI